MINIFKPNESGEKISIVAILASAYYVCMPLSIVPLPIDMSLLKLISMLVGGLLLIFLFVGKNDLRLNYVHFFLALYVIYSFTTLFMLKDTVAWENLRGIIETTVLFILISSRIYNQREKKFILNAWLIVGIISVLTMLLGAAEIADDKGRVTMGIAGTNEDPNQLCGYFFMPVLICLSRIMDKKQLIYKKIFYFALTLAMIYVVFTTGSRGGLVAVLACVMAFVLLVADGIGNKLKIIVSIVLVAIIFAIILFPLLPESIVERLSVERVLEDKGSGRFDLWLIIWDAIVANNKSLIFGYGLGSTGIFLIAAGKGNTVAHNHWLQIWCDQGFIGMILFALVVGAGFIRTYKRNKVVAVSMLGMFALSMSLTLYASYKPFWNVLMMSAMNYVGGKNFED